MKKHMVKIWGGAWNNDANPSIKKDYGINEGYYYFDNEDDVNSFLKILNKAEYKNQGIQIVKRYGEMTYQRTVVTAVFEYEDKEFIIHRDFGYEYPKEVAIDIFEKGNYSNDVNRSLLIRKEYGDNSIPRLPVGNLIKLKNLKVELAEDDLKDTYVRVISSLGKFKDNVK